MIKTNIKEEVVQGHRFGKKLTNSDYGTVAFLLSRNDILSDKKANANNFSDKELTYNCIYFLIGYEQNNDSTTEMMYVGQAGIRNNGQSVLDRLNEHAWKGNDPARYIDKWTDIVVVTNEKKAWGATWKSISPTVRTDAGVLERRQAQRRWSGREQDGVASEHNGALPQRGRFGSSITPNLCVLCYSLHPHCLQAFPTSYSFPIPCVRVEKHEHFLFPHFFHFFLKE